MFKILAPGDPLTFGEEELHFEASAVRIKHLLPVEFPLIVEKAPAAKETFEASTIIWIETPIIEDIELEVEEVLYTDAQPSIEPVAPVASVEPVESEEEVVELIAVTSEPEAPIVLPPVMMETPEKVSISWLIRVVDYLRAKKQALLQLLRRYIRRRGAEK